MRKQLWLAVVAAAFVACDSPIDPRSGAAADPAAVVVPGAVVAHATGSDISSRGQGVRQLAFDGEKHADGAWRDRAPAQPPAPRGVRAAARGRDALTKG